MSNELLPMICGGLGGDTVGTTGLGCETNADVELVGVSGWRLGVSDDGEEVSDGPGGGGLLPGTRLDVDVGGVEVLVAVADITAVRVRKLTAVRTLGTVSRSRPEHCFTTLFTPASVK